MAWLQNPELRRRVQVGLNKGEAKNALARAVFFNRLGELRDLTPLSSTAHSGDLVLPFSRFFLEFFSSKLNHRLVACCHQTWILLLKLPAFGPKTVLSIEALAEAETANQKTENRASKARNPGANAKLSFTIF